MSSFSHSSSRVLLVCLAGILLSCVFSGVFAIGIPGASTLAGPSMQINTGDATTIDGAQKFGFRILALLKLLISGVALIWMVLLGAYMVIFSENEERVKSQKKQVTYTLIGFLFLNIPGILISLFFSPSTPRGSISDPGSWGSVSGGSIFWDTYGMGGFLGNLVAFFRVFLFGVAILMFTWGFFRLIVSAGDEEKQKMAKNRILYGSIGLLFLAFVEGWSRMIAGADFTEVIPKFGNSLLGLALFFAAPVAIFTLMVGAYYYIGSGGDEERTKKGKRILINTFIASLIFLASLSFLTDLIQFTV